jgi:peptide-methionine (S)-S-oxide reductase
MNDSHLVLGGSIRGPWAEGTELIYFGMGCYWGAEKKLWAVPGVISTAVGFMGGITENPDYKLVCTGTTGHAEIVLVAYDPSATDFYELLSVFWENHDPTQGNRQGNDIGTQYRSAVYWTTAEQEHAVRASADAFGEILSGAGLGPITTELRSADGLPFWYAEEFHQQYLVRVPNGYDCHAHTGFHLPSRELLGL